MDILRLEYLLRTTVSEVSADQLCSSLCAEDSWRIAGHGAYLQLPASARGFFQGSPAIRLPVSIDQAMSTVCDGLPDSTDPRLTAEQLPLSPLLSRVTWQGALALVSAALVERRIVLVSRCAEAAAAACYSLLGLLYPLEWQVSPTVNTAGGNRLLCVIHAALPNYIVLRALLYGLSFGIQRILWCRCGVLILCTGRCASCPTARLRSNFDDANGQHNWFPIALYHRNHCQATTGNSG